MRFRLGSPPRGKNCSQQSSGRRRSIKEALAREGLSRATQEAAAKASELAETERRLQQVRDAQVASQAELANAHSEQERLTQEREQLEQAIASLTANRDRLAAEQASF